MSVHPYETVRCAYEVCHFHAVCRGGPADDPILVQLLSVQVCTHTHASSGTRKQDKGTPIMAEEKTKLLPMFHACNNCLEVTHRRAF